MPIDLNHKFFEGVTSPLTEGEADSIGEIMDQKETNMCFGFAAQGALYSLQRLKTGHAELISVQELMDTLHVDFPPIYAIQEDGSLEIGIKGLGNSVENTYKFGIKRGFTLDSDWPFKGELSTTNEKERLKYIQRTANICAEYDSILDGDQASVCAKLHEQPVTTIVYGTKSLAFWKHTSGVFPGATDDEIEQYKTAREQKLVLTFTRHAMLLVGYGVDENGCEYYLAKNADGEDFGFHGYVKIARTACSKFVYPKRFKIVEPSAKYQEKNGSVKEKTKGPKVKRKVLKKGKG